jgi:hypothetical protein
MQKGFSHREEAKSTKIFKKKFKKLKKLLGVLSFFFVSIKISSRSSRLRGKREVFAVDSFNHLRHQFDDLARLGVTIGLQFRVNQFPVHHDLEPASVRGNQRHRFDGVLVVPKQFTNQAYSPGSVMSNRTIGDLDFQHGFLHIMNIRKL